MRKIIIGKVSCIDSEKMMLQVTYDNVVSDFLYILSSEYCLPQIGDNVICMFLDNKKGGICLGKYFNLEDNIPINLDDKDKCYYKFFDSDAYIKYDKDTKELLIKANSVRIEQEGDTE